MTFPAQAFGTNCYVLARSAGEECLIIDPGIGVIPTLQAALTEHRLRPAAVVLTHGHLDHTFSVTSVCADHGIPVLIHRDDEYRLTGDPIDSLGPELRAMVSQAFGPEYTWVVPDDIRTFDTSAPIEFAGLKLDVLHAPGHTEGSVLFQIDGIPDTLRHTGEPLASTLISGDVLFRGSIGRTDLPGGSMSVMTTSLRDVVWPLPDDQLVLPGHGPATTIAAERANNPYLQEAARS